MVFAWELIQTYWSINVTEPKSELPASDQIRKLQLAAAKAVQNQWIRSRGLEAKSLRQFQVSSDFTREAS